MFNALMDALRNDQLACISNIRTKAQFDKAYDYVRVAQARLGERAFLTTFFAGDKLWVERWH